MTSQIAYDIALCGEAWYLFKAWLLIKCRLKTVTINERYELKQRRIFLMARMEERK